MRSLLILEMFKRENREPKVDANLISDTNPSQAIFKKFADRFKTADIKVLDVFAGGGSIPFESSRLGFETFSAELNPVASLLQETIFKSVQVPKYSEKLRESGNIVIDNLYKRFSKYFEFTSFYAQKLNQYLLSFH